MPYAPPPEHAAPFLDPTYKGKIGDRIGGFADPTWNDADRRRYAEAATQAVRRYDWSVVAQQIMLVYETVAGSGTKVRVEA